MLKELFSKKYRKYTITTLIVMLSVFGLGFLWHFLFELSGNNYFVGLFAPVNESVWEHLKILFFPFVILAIVEYFIYGKECYNFFSSKLFGLSIGLLTIITCYYTAVGALGINNMPVNLAIFVIAVVLAYVLSYMRMLKTPRMAGSYFETAAIALTSVLFSLFLIFTYHTPCIPLFRDPTTMNYSVW